MCLPFVIAVGVHIPVLLIEGVCYFNALYIIFALVDVYFIYMAYSVYYAFRNGDSRAAYEA